MSARVLSRAPGPGRATAPVRLVHLGLGNFFRAHQAWYTDHAPEADEWGYAGFCGRGRVQADQLTAQGGLYTLVTRASEGDRFEIVSSVSRAHAADDHGAFLDYFRSPELGAVTITVTEAGYFRRPDGGLDVRRPEIQADLSTLRADVTALVRTAPARLVAGLAARRRADAGPLAVVPCDNVAGNGAIAERVVRDFAELLDPGLAAWLRASMAIVSTTVDRITPRTTPGDVETVRAATGLLDACPVVTEPFMEWVLSGTFPAGRPSWQDSGATFTDDVKPYEHRKLWLLNGAHSLLAYAGSVRGHATVAGAVTDTSCRAWVEQWWAEASPHLNQPNAEVAAYRGALLDRFANKRIHHRLAQIGTDGSQKLPIRVLPVLRAERAAGRLPEGASRILAAWICYLRGGGACVSDVMAGTLVPLATGSLTQAVPRVVRELGGDLGADADLLATVVDQCQQLLSPGKT